MNRSCILCGCLCLTGLSIGRRMLCCGCEASLLSLPPRPQPGLSSLYADHLPAVISRRSSLKT